MESNSYSDIYVPKTRKERGWRLLRYILLMLWYNHVMEPQQTQNIVEYDLPGEKLPQETNDISQINKYGFDLYSKNRDFIREKVKDNWYAVIDPTTGKFVASLDPLNLYEYTKENYPNKLFYYIGIIKNYFSSSFYEHI